MQKEGGSVQFPVLRNFFSKLPLTILSIMGGAVKGVLIIIEDGDRGTWCILLQVYIVLLHKILIKSFFK